MNQLSLYDEFRTITIELCDHNHEFTLDEVEAKLVRVSKLAQTLTLKPMSS